MDYLNNLIGRYPVLKACKDDINNAYELLKEMYNNRGKALICGNGGSAADSDHIVGELMKGFYKKRPISGELKAKLGELSDKLQMPLRAISLTNHIALSTAFMNDVAPEMIYAQQVLGYGDMGDCLIAISTSGNSKNVVNAIKAAKALGLNTIGLTGELGGELSVLSDVCIKVPAKLTANVQELHLPVYHTICAMLEDYFFDL